MPYIKKEKREKWDKIIREISLLQFEFHGKEGELNYFITKLLKAVYIESYSEYNKAIGLLESIKLEFYRKVISKYENQKEKENGEV